MKSQEYNTSFSLTEHNYRARYSTAIIIAVYNLDSSLWEGFTEGTYPSRKFANILIEQSYILSQYIDKESHCWTVDFYDTITLYLKVKQKEHDLIFL